MVVTGCAAYRGLINMDGLDFIEFIENTNNSSTNDELFGILRNSLSYLGYKYVTYSFLSDHNSFGIKAKHGILKDCPSGWFDYYFSNGYQHIDPRIRHGMISNKAFYWNDIGKHVALNKKQERFLKETEDAGLHAGIAVPIHGRLSETAGVTVAAEEKGIKPNANLLSLVHALLHQFHLSYCSLNQDGALQCHDNPLTAREEEVLKWCGSGKSNS